MRLILLTAVLALTLQPRPAPPQGAAASIEGRALRLGTSEPLASVQVTLTLPSPSSVALTPQIQTELESLASLISTNPNLADTTISSLISSRETALNLPPGTLTIPKQTAVITDTTGSFSFKDLPPGRYSLRAQREGYFAPPINGNAPNVVTTTITIEAGKPVPKTDLLMIQGGIISGRVRDPNGQPVSGIQVAPNRIQYSNGRETIVTVATTKQTDDRGEFRLFWLPPGQYYVGVTPRAPGAVPGPQDSWVRTFFPGVTDPRSATLVTVKDGAEGTGIDINIQAGDGRTFKISGIATNPLPFLRANPTTNVVDRSVGTFVLAPREPGILDSATPPQMQNALPVAQRANGEFEIRNIRPGLYDLYTLYLDSTMRRYFTSRTPLEVRNADVAGLNLAIDPGVTFSGEVVINGSGGKPITLTSLRVALRAMGTLPPPFATTPGQLQLDAAGKFTADNIPAAKYTALLTGLPDTAYVEDIRQAGATVFDEGFTLSSQPSPIQIVVNPAGLTVGGIVENADRKPAAGATVVLVPQESRRQNAALYKNVTTDAFGNFTFLAVPPGQYTVFAWESVMFSAWQNARFLSKYEASGKSVNISANSQSQIQVQLIPAEAPR